MDHIKSRLKHRDLALPTSSSLPLYSRLFTMILKNVAAYAYTGTYSCDAHRSLVLVAIANFKPVKSRGFMRPKRISSQRMCFTGRARMHRNSVLLANTNIEPVESREHGPKKTSSQRMRAMGHAKTTGKYTLSIANDDHRSNSGFDHDWDIKLGATFV